MMKYFPNEKVGYIILTNSDHGYTLLEKEIRKKIKMNEN